MFTIHLTDEAKATRDRLKAEATKAGRGKEKKKSTKAEGLYKQVAKTIQFLSQNPKHQGLQTHEYRSLQHPYNRNDKVFVAYAQNKTPSAYRVFWCYGPNKGDITIIAITPHP